MQYNCFVPIDLTKGFVTVSREILLHKLKKYGITLVITNGSFINKCGILRCDYRCLSVTSEYN